MSGWSSYSCWRWPGAAGRNGYGLVWVAGRTRLAHRFVYEAVKGPIPPGLQIDHLCRVRNCVQPEHMEIVTNRENVLRGLNGRVVTHCPRGHEYTPENLRRKATRECRTCHNSRGQLRRVRSAASPSA